MAIGEGWVNGAWEDAGWATGAWVQAGAAKTIGGTSQLGAITSTGGLTVQNQETIGATSQLGSLSSTAGLQTGRQIGGTAQLGVVTSSGTIQVGDVASAKGGATGTEYENWRSREHKKRMKLLQQDDEEISALLILEMIRRAA